MKAEVTQRAALAAHRRGMTAAERLAGIIGGLGFDPGAVVQRMRSGRRIKLSPEERQRRRRAQNAKAQAAVRARRQARGLRGDGRPRQRAWHESHAVLQVARAAEGVWIRLALVRVPRRGEVVRVSFNAETR